MGVVSLRNVEHKDRGVRAAFKVLPMKTGFVVQRISWESDLDGEIERGGWTEAWVVRTKPRYLEQGLVDSFTVPADWVANHTSWDVANKCTCVVSNRPSIIFSAYSWAN